MNFELKVPKAVIVGVSLACHTVVVATYCITKMITTCSPMNMHFLDTMNVASTDKDCL